MSGQMKYKSALKNKWNKESEKLVKQIGEKAQGYIWMCERDATYYSRLSTSFTVVAAFLSLAIGTSQIVYTNGISNSTNSENAHENANVLTSLGVINYIVGGLITIMKLNNFESVVDKFKQSEAKFRDIYADIQQQLSMQRVDRFPAKEYIRLVSKKYNAAASDKTLSIRRKTANKFRKDFASKNISFPEISGDIKEIIIAEPQIIGYGNAHGGNGEYNTETSDEEYVADPYGDSAQADFSDTGGLESTPSEHTHIRKKRKEELQQSSSDHVHHSTGSEDNIDHASAPGPGNSDASEYRKKTKITGDEEDSSGKKYSKESHDKEEAKVRTSKKKTKKYNSGRPQSTYANFQHHNHQPNLNSVQYQLTRLNE